MYAMKRPGIMLYGGTFDPIHLGHLIIARNVREQLGLKEVVFIPSATPPHKTTTPITDFNHRSQMVKLAIQDEQGFGFDDCEIKRSGPSYTLETIAYFRKKLGKDAQIFWIIGADTLPELSTWYRAGELVESCDIITVSRPGWDNHDLKSLQDTFTPEQITKLQRGILPTPRIDISSTDIRNRVAAGLSILYLVPEPVREYIHDQQLYLQE